MNLKPFAYSTLAALVLAGCAPGSPPTPTPKTEDEKSLYAVGVAMSKQVEVFHMTPAELDLMIAGLRAGSAGTATVNLDEAMPNVQKLAKARADAAGAALTAKDPEYLEKAAKEAGAVKTDSGLVYIPLKEGTGASPKASDRVTVHYTGKLSSGKVFDSSVTRGEPATFPLGGVIPCWTEGVQKMKVGGKARLVCPYTIAYGENGRPPVIPPKAALDFEVELLEIAGAPAAPRAPDAKK